MWNAASGSAGRRSRLTADKRDKGWGYPRRAPAALLFALALSGCVTTRYVTVPCVSKGQALPAEPPKIHSQLTGEADKDLRIVAGSAIRLRAWGEGLHDILEGCREPQH